MFKRALAILIAITGLNANAGSYSDLWWNPSESGWGINFIQQFDTIFATMFVYGADGKTSWYVGSSMVTTPADSSRFTGDLYETTGPWFGTTFNPASVVVRKVGTITFTATPGALGTTGNLAYSVDGVDVIKSIQRQTWRTVSVEGSYRAQVVSLPLASNECTAGPEIDSTSDMTVSDAGQINFYDGGSTVMKCQISGPITQNGSLKKLIGTINCPVSGFSGIAYVYDWRAEGSTATKPTVETMTGVIAISRSGTACGKFLQFAALLK